MENKQVNEEKSQLNDVEVVEKQKKKTVKWKIIVAIIVGIIFIVTAFGENGKDSVGVQGTYINTRGITNATAGTIKITDSNFIWNSYGVELANGAYEVDEENHLIKVKDEKYDFVFTLDDDGKVEAISRVVNGTHQEIYYRAYADE